MEFKEEQVGKNFNMENAPQENEGVEQNPVLNGEEAHHVARGEGQVPGGNVSRMQIKGLVPNFRWAIPNRHIDHHEVGDNDDGFIEQMTEIRRKIREQQMRHYVHPQTPEPDNHDGFSHTP
ncbi:protein BEX4 [Choloepus didactylus]|uniref:protein BEX4 n=1 Tax=Choloepus didactylus TaxID=27675 RepID=UPI0018A0594B|nr:protein BEX4 [Choloepus didactylus]XP_037677853.1 protein BEX4 [Choloepus didactylus]